MKHDDVPILEDHLLPLLQLFLTKIYHIKCDSVEGSIENVVVNLTHTFY